MENTTPAGFETHLAQYLYEKIVDSGTKIVLVGQANIARNAFHETLNTLEF